MAIWKRVLPSGQIRWQFSYRDGSGQRRAKMFRTKAEAVAFETKARGELAAGVHVADSATATVAEAAELWLRAAEVRGREAGTIKGYAEHVRLHINPLLGNVRLARFTQSAIEDFVDQLLKTRSKNLARSVLVSLKGVLKTARKRGLIAHNPAADTVIEDDKRGRAKVTIPSRAELKMLLDVSAQLWDERRAWRPMLVTAIFTGLRCSELRGLCWDSVDLDHGTIEVKQRADYRNVIGPPKSRAGQRTVPLAPMVLNTLRRWRDLCPETSLGLVFPTSRGTIFSNRVLHEVYWDKIQCLLRLVDSQGRPQYKFHALRHAAASMYIEQGMSPKRIQALLGHASITVTFDVYGHLMESHESDQQAMAAIEARLFGARNADATRAD